MLESPDDQWRTAVTRGNFESSCGVAGVLSDSSVVESTSLVAGFASMAARGCAGLDCVVGTAGRVISGLFCTIAPLICAFLSFHQTPATKAAAMTVPTSITRSHARCDSSAGDCPRLSVGSGAAEGSAAIDAAVESAVSGRAVFSFCSFASSISFRGAAPGADEMAAGIEAALGMAVGFAAD